ncbi:MAG: aromatic aminobenezylarsenical efflux permease ArsG family transporter [Salinivirgaceae bacterium]|jgi:cytochrome c-type biogenesis protein|nr:aromatic aminobenezylarsenical efflux permease ArsG family transporter [Salinivirgaceae bacterium]
MEFLQNLFEQSNIPILSAFLLGLMTAISPCPLATNITAIGYIGKDIENKRRVFSNGLVYTLGRAITYTLIGMLFFFGSSQFEISSFLQKNGEKILGPLLIIVGLFMLGIIKINLSIFGNINEKIGNKAKHSYWGALLLGILFALAFCPYSGVLYFGMLIPMTITSASGLYLPLVFALATGIPVIIFAWFLAFSVSKVGSFYNGIKAFEQWFRWILGSLFILIGLYYLYILFL